MPKKEALRFDPLLIDFKKCEFHLFLIRSKVGYDTMKSFLGLTIFPRDRVAFVYFLFMEFELNFQ